MIYKFNVLNDDNKTKSFYLSADSQSQLYRRILSTYGMTRDRVTILAEYKETGFDGYELHKEHVKETKHSQKVIDKSKEVWSKLTKKGEPWKSNYISKYGFTEISINGESDVRDLVKRYKKVKVYWEPGEKRGSKKLYAVVKN